MFKVDNVNKTSRFIVVLAPHLTEFIDIQERYGQIIDAFSVLECINYDNDEKIDEYLRNQDIEHNEKDVGYDWGSTSEGLTSILHHLLISFVLTTQILRGVLSS